MQSHVREVPIARGSILELGNNHAADDPSDEIETWLPNDAATSIYRNKKNASATARSVSLLVSTS